MVAEHGAEEYHAEEGDAERNWRGEGRSAPARDANLVAVHPAATAPSQRRQEACGASSSRPPTTPSRTIGASKLGYSTGTLSAAVSMPTGSRFEPRQTLVRVSRVGSLKMRDTGSPWGSTSKGHTAARLDSGSKRSASAATV